MAFVCLIANFLLALAWLPSEGARRPSTNRRPSTTTGSVVLNANENLWGAMQYSFRASATGLNFAEPAQVLFDVSGSDYHVLSVPQVRATASISKSAEETSRLLTSGTSLEGSYGAFAGAAQANLERYNSRKYQTVRVSKVIWAQKYHVAPLFAAPWSKLRPDVVQFMRTHSANDIVTKYGEFYAEDMLMGGQFETVHVMEKTVSEDETSLSLQLEASYSSILVSAVASSQNSLTEHKLVSSYSMRTSWHVSGGNSTMWLGLTESNMDSIQERWANSVNDDNLFPISVRYAPIWKLLKHHDADKAEELEAFLLNKWTNDLNSLPEYLPAPDPIYGHYHWMHGDHEYSTRATPYGWGWEAHGVAFHAFSAEVAGSVPIYEYYSSGGTEHEYTTRATSNGSRWRSHGVVFHAFSWQATGTVPIYEYYNSGRGDREYTTRSNPYNSDWRSNGVRFYAFA